MRAKRTIAGLILDAFLTLVLAILIIVFFVLLASRQVPDKYIATMQMPEESKQRLANAFLSDAWDLKEKQDTNDGFEITVSDEEINAYLLGGLVSLDEFIPPDIANPQVHFEENAVVLMGTITPPNFHPIVVSIYCRPKVAYDGKLTFTVEKVKGGALRISKDLVGRALEGLQDFPLTLPNVEIELAPGKITIYREGNERTA